MSGDPNTDTWTVAEAKAKLSEVIDRSTLGGPQTITRNGRTAVVVVGAEEWERKTKRVGNLAEFFAASPLRESGLPRRFESRILFVDGAVADLWGTMVARSEAAGRPISVIDAFVAATAGVHGLTLVMRNDSGFKSVLNAIVNPWAAI